MTAPAAHVLTLEANDDRAQFDAGQSFRASCSCGWASIWRPTNACMGNGRRHLAGVRRAAREVAR